MIPRASPACQLNRARRSSPATPAGRDAAPRQARLCLADQARGAIDTLAARSRAHCRRRIWFPPGPGLLDDPAWRAFDRRRYASGSASHTGTIGLDLLQMGRVALVAASTIAIGPESSPQYPDSLSTVDGAGCYVHVMFWWSVA
jgi:hypothetical protein